MTHSIFRYVSSKKNQPKDEKKICYLLRDGIIRLEPGRATPILKESTTEAERKQLKKQK